MFADKLISEIKTKKSFVCVGLDPFVERIPKEIIERHKKKEKEEITSICNAIYEFNCGIIDSCAQFAACVKPQIAFYEIWGHKGYEVFQKTVKYAKSKSLLVIADAKRNDISSTAKAYAKAFFGELMGVDALTVNPYLGSDGIFPFLEYGKKGIFVLLKTSNPSSKEIQLLLVNKDPLYLKIADYIKEWGEKSIGTQGFSNVCAVVGATFPKEAKILRERMPSTLFLVPGIGTQGGQLKDITSFFNDNKLGAIINSSREINYAYEKTGSDYKTAASKKAMELRDQINKILNI